MRAVRGCGQAGKRGGEIEHRKAAPKDGGGVLGRRFLRDDHVFGPGKHFFQARVEQTADVRNRVQDELLVAAVDLIHPDLRIEHTQAAAFADERFEQRHHRALAQVVGVLLEGEAEDADALGGKIEHAADGARQVLGVCRAGWIPPAAT